MLVKNKMSRKEKQEAKRIHEARMAVIEPLLDSIQEQRWALDEQCEIAFEKTGFGDPHQYALDDRSIAARATLTAYEILPHQYVASKLNAIDALIDDLTQSIESGAFEEITKSLHDLQEGASVIFAEVNEFLNSPLAKMTRREWEEHPSWDDWNNAYSELNWSIGTVPMFDNFGWGGFSFEEILEKLENAIRN